MDEELQRRFDQVKIDMMDYDSGTVFFSSLLSYVQIIIDDTQSTAWTDGLQIGFNSEFVLKCDVEELKWVIMHELGHIIYDHIPIAMDNKDWIDHNLHNIAGDHYINLDLKAKGYTSPHWMDFYEDPKYTNMGTIQIYTDLDKGPKPPPQPNGMGIDIKMPSNDMPKEEYNERVLGNIIKATHQAEMQGDRGIGSIPGHVARIVKEITEPKLPWWTILANHMASYARSDYSMKRLNRKYMPEFIIPGLYSEAMDHMLAASDCSGSITPKELAMGLSETRYVFDTLKPKSLRLMSFDVQVHLNELFNEGEELPAEIDCKGGGGTDVELILKYIREEDPKLSLIFTDGGFSMPNLENIPGDLFWIIKGCPNFDPPKGTVIHMEPFL